MQATVWLFRIDVASGILPEALVGRQIRVHWTDDDAWYAGKVAAYLPETRQHKVSCSCLGCLQHNKCTNRAERRQQSPPCTCGSWQGTVL